MPATTKTAAKDPKAIAAPLPQPPAPAPQADPDQAVRLRELEAENKRLNEAIAKVVNESLEAAQRGLDERMARLEAMQSSGSAPVFVETDGESPDSELASKILFLYDPSAADNDRMTQSYFSFSVTERDLPTEVEGVTRSELVTISVIPGIQEFKRSHFEELSANTQPDHVRGLFTRGVVRNFSDQADFRILATTDPLLAQDAIAKCNSRTLLAKWAGYWNHLPKPVQERLTRRETELQVTRSATKQTVFGTPIT